MPWASHVFAKDYHCWLKTSCRLPPLTKFFFILTKMITTFPEIISRDIFQCFISEQWVVSKRETAYTQGSR